MHLITYIHTNETNPKIILQVVIFYEVLDQDFLLLVLVYFSTVGLFAIHYKIIQLYVQNIVYHDHAQTREEVKTVTYFSRQGTQLRKTWLSLCMLIIGRLLHNKERILS